MININVKKYADAYGTSEEIPIESILAKELAEAANKYDSAVQISYMDKAKDGGAIYKTENYSDGKLLENQEGILGEMQVIPSLLDGKIYMCAIKDIYYIESVDKRTYLYTKNACYETKSRLYELEDKLGKYFARCSKAMIINLKKIKNVSSEFGGRMNAKLLNDENIVISRSYVKDIKGRLGI